MFGTLSFNFDKHEGMELVLSSEIEVFGTKTILTMCHSVYSTRKIHMVCLCYININSAYEIEHCREINNLWLTNMIIYFLQFNTNALSSKTWIKYFHNRKKRILLSSSSYFHGNLNCETMGAFGFIERKNNDHYHAQSHY